MSARCISVSTSRPWSGNIAMPTLARTSRVRPWKRNGSSIARRERVGDDLGLLDGGAERQQHGELVAADAGHELGAGDAGLQARADLAQQPVAGVVAERVVELLEVVEVDQQQRELGLDARGRRSWSRRGAANSLRRLARPVSGSCMRVVLALGGERAQLVLELAAVGRVAHVEHEAVDARVVQAVGGDDVEVAVAAVAVGEAQRQVARVVGAAVGVGEVAVERGRGRPGGRGRAGGVPTIASGSWPSTPRIDSACQRMRWSAPTIVTTSVEFWTIEVSRRWMISEALQRGRAAPGTRNGASAMRHGAGEVGVELLVAAAGVGAEQRGHPQHVAGERAQRAAVEAAEDEAEQRQERVAAARRAGRGRRRAPRAARARARSARGGSRRPSSAARRERREHARRAAPARLASRGEHRGARRGRAPTSASTRNSSRNRANGVCGSLMDGGTDHLVQWMSDETRAVLRRTVTRCTRSGDRSGLPSGSPNDPTSGGTTVPTAEERLAILDEVLTEAVSKGCSARRPDDGAARRAHDLARRAHDGELRLLQLPRARARPAHARGGDRRRDALRHAVLLARARYLLLAAVRRARGAAGRDVRRPRARHADDVARPPGDAAGARRLHATRCCSTTRSTPACRWRPTSCASRARRSS